MFPRALFAGVFSLSLLAQSPDAMLTPAKNEHRLTCTVTPVKPVMSFSFSFQSGFVLAVPARQFAGAPGQVRIIVRVAGRNAEPVYYSRTMAYHGVPANTRYTARTSGGWLLGEGDYDVAFAFIDSQNRACRKRWTVHARRNRSERGIPMEIPPNTVVSFQSLSIPQPAHTAGPPRRLTVLMHVTPMSVWRLGLRPGDTMRLLGTLRSVMRHGSFTEVRVVAFNLDQQAVFFRTDHLDTASWHQLERAMSGLQLYTVPISVLQRPRGEVDVLTRLAAEEASATPRSDAVLFLGAPDRSDTKLNEPERESLAPALGLPVYYFELRPYWGRGADFPDLVEHVVKNLGGRTLRIHSSADMAAAIRALDETNPGA